MRSSPDRSPKLSARASRSGAVLREMRLEDKGSGIGMSYTETAPATSAGIGRWQRITKMGKLITVVGNTGVGKTTLVGLLSRRMDLTTGLEQHEARPFQRDFSVDLRGRALANQVDYLLFRAEQENAIRADSRIGIQDGGLDMDFHVFTKHFHRRGYLTEQEFNLCDRLFHLLRALLPPPEVILWMQASPSVIVRRFRGRGEVLRIAGEDELADLDTLLELWLGSRAAGTVIRVDAGRDDPTYADALEDLCGRIQAALAVNTRVGGR